MVEAQQMKLLDWQAIAIAECPDNIYAETIACEQATQLAAEWYGKLALEGGLSVIIQGTSSRSSSSSTTMQDYAMQGSSGTSLTSSKLLYTNSPITPLPISQEKAMPLQTILPVLVLSSRHRPKELTLTHKPPSHRHSSAGWRYHLQQEQCLTLNEHPLIYLPPCSLLAAAPEAPARAGKVPRKAQGPRHPSRNTDHLLENKQRRERPLLRTRPSSAATAQRAKDTTLWPVACRDRHNRCLLREHPPTGDQPARKPKAPLPADSPTN